MVTHPVATEGSRRVARSRNKARTASGTSIPMISPSDGKVIGRIARGGAADRIHGDTFPFLEGYLVPILREPRGVTGQIIPWNYPAQMFGQHAGCGSGGGHGREKGFEALREYTVARTIVLNHR